MLRNGKGRMQRIRKEQSPAPAYVMPSSHCQPATGPLLSTQGGERREGEVAAQSAPSTPRAAGKF